MAETVLSNYGNFINNKVSISVQSGFDVDRNNLNDKMFEYQKDIVR